MQQVKTAQGDTILIDDCDYALVSSLNWTTVKRRNLKYAITHIRSESGFKQVYLHRFLLDPPKGMYIDHIDSNGLNNTRTNIRICTPSENSKNARKLSEKSSIYKGVSKWTRVKRYAARIRYNGRDQWLGFFDTERDAALAYNSAAIQYYGEFARLNNV